MSKWIVITLLILTACSAAEEQQLYAGVNFPADYAATFEHYATVDRGDADHSRSFHQSATRCRACGAPVACRMTACWSSTCGRPSWTKVVSPCWMRTDRYRKAEMQPTLHVAHKRMDWSSEDFGSAARAGNWNFGSFERASGAHVDENLTACFNCHQANARNDFVYSAQQLVRYAMSDRDAVLLLRAAPS